jgi:hypothetical protein
MNKKQKKLLLECVDHLMEWELHMERATTTKLIKDMFGIDIPITKTVKKYSELIELRKQLTTN